MSRLLRILFKNTVHLPGIYRKIHRFAKHPDDFDEAEKYKYLQTVFNRVYRAGKVTLEIHGQENIPKEDGFVVYANHQGMIDFMAVSAGCDRPLRLVLLKDLYKIPFLKDMADGTHSLPIDRDDPRQSLEVFRTIIEEVPKGHNYLIFPEGIRSQGGPMRKFHSGGFRCATKTHCPVVPVALIDSYKVLDEPGYAPVSVQVQYLPPIYYEEYQSMNPSELADLVHDRIEETLRRASVKANPS